MQPDGGGAGSTVERKGQRTLRPVIFLLLCVGHKEDLGARLFTLRFLLAIGRLLLQDHRAGRDSVFDLPAANPDGMVCYD